MTEEPATFINELQDVVVTEKQQAVFSCSANKEGVPIKWTFEKTPIQSNEKFCILANGKQHQLMVENCNFDDEGKYRAQIGTRQTSGSLTVKG